MRMFLMIAGIIIGIGLICFVIVCIISAIENRKLKATAYTVASPKIPKEFNDYRMVVLADLHNACYGNQNDKLLELIREQRPDCILIAGDMIVGKPGHSTDVPAHLINELAKEYPVYYGKGNHELRVGLYKETYGDLWECYLQQLDERITWLSNEQVVLNRNGASIYLYGLDMEPRYYKRFRHTPMDKTYLNSLLGSPKKDGFNILIAHNPDYFYKYAQWGADLVFAGHLHGGLVRLPWFGGMVSPMFHFFPKYDKGRYKKEDSEMLLSGGLGNHTFKFRVNNIPEILVITLTSNVE